MALFQAHPTAFALQASSCLALVFVVANTSLSHLYYFSGLVLTPAVWPIIFALKWADCGALAAISGALGGLAAGICAWLVGAATFEGQFNFCASTVEPLFFGTMVASGTSLILCLVITFF